MEKHYAFIKAGRVENTLVFAEQNDSLAQTICDENGYDSFVWLDEADVPHRYATYDEKTKTFIEPTLDYLYSIGISNKNQEMSDAIIAEQAVIEAPKTK